MALLVQADVAGTEWDFLLEAARERQTGADTLRNGYGDDEDEYEDFGKDDTDDEFEDDLDDDFDDDDEFDDDDSDDLDEEEELDDDDL